MKWEQNRAMRFHFPKNPFFRILIWFLVAIIAIHSAVFLFPEVFPPGSTSELIEFLTLILAFVAIVNYFLSELHKKEIEAQKQEFDKRLNDHDEQTRKTLEDERFALRASANNATAASSLYLYIYQIDPAFKAKYREKILSTALRYSRLAVTRLNDIKDKSAYLEIELSCLNNYCLALAFTATQADEKKYDGYAADRRAALESLKILKEKSDGNSRLQATVALVLWVYAETDEARYEAHRILDEIINSETEDELRDVWNLILGERRLPCDIQKCPKK